jgi:hypothetical protein
MRFKFSVFFVRAGVGWSESWYTREGTAEACILTMEKYMGLRQKMLPPSWSIMGLRAGRTSLSTAETDGRDALRQSQVYYPTVREFEKGPQTIKVPGDGTFTPAGNPGQEVIPNVCLQERITFDTNRSTSRYLVGVPLLDLTDTPGGDNLAGQDLWKGFLDQLEVLVRGDDTEAGRGGPLFIKARTGSIINTNTWSIKGWGLTESYPSDVFFVTGTDQLGSLAIGDLVHIRNSKLIPSVSFGGAAKQQQMNGTWYVGSIALGVPAGGFAQVTLKGTKGIPAQQMKNFGTWQRVRFALFPVQNMQDVRLRTHKRGKPTLVSRGRRLSRIKLDP